MAPTPHDITGLVLAGGRGSRMGGVDKGLQLHLGQPLALHALHRLQPQVGRTMINANRHLDAYAAMGVPVWPDALPDHPGPLAGFLAGLSHCTTPWLVTVPCDTPGFPLDLVAQLAQAIDQQGTDIAIAATREADGRMQAQPVFCLLRASLLDRLTRATEAGERRIERWARQQHCSEVPFDDNHAFFNVNTLAELQSIQRSAG
ncbi:molybdenum cofactor guanylyltransferase MobA [Ideonella sp. DXS29W]|uniref:Molybdenum cofactor guanylyltransferase n=1 Tax=Ideonella lacteola TaxID=2984193 RepID=A0ABU9BY31_9BURK